MSDDGERKRGKNGTHRDDEESKIMIFTNEAEGGRG
jgi:hypothetical protein